MKNAAGFVSHRSNLNIDGAFLDGVWRTKARSGEERLMLAVLEDAIDSFFKYFRATGEIGKQIFKETSAWIFETNSEWVFSFENVCDRLGISWSCLRQELSRGVRAQRARPSFLEGRKSAQSGSVA